MYRDGRIDPSAMNIFGSILSIVAHILWKKFIQECKKRFNSVSVERKQHEISEKRSALSTIFLLSLPVVLG